MTTMKTNSIVTVLVLAAGTVACGVRDVPTGNGTADADASEGGAAGRRGAAGEGGTGGCPSGLIEDCGDGLYDGVVTAACMLRLPNPFPLANGSEVIISDLTVLEAGPGDFSTCADGGDFLYRGDSEYLASVTLPSMAFRLADTSGQTWLVEFANGPTPEDLLLPGETVDLSFWQWNSINPHGYLALERAGSPIIFLTYGFLRGSWEPSVTTASGCTLCGVGEGCGTATSRVTVGVETSELMPDERAEIGGLVIQNDWFWERGSCLEYGISDYFNDSFLLGGYRPR